jgi:hypothetical protein
VRLGQNTLTPSGELAVLEDKIIDLFPFAFSAIIGLISSLKDKIFTDRIVSVIPNDYGISDNRKITIASYANEEHAKVEFIIAIFSALVGVVVLLVKTHASILAIITSFLVLVLAVVSLLTLFNAEAGSLGTLKKSFTGLSFRPEWIYTIALIVTNIVLGMITWTAEPS